jgi:hypothetical protein
MKFGGLGSLQSGDNPILKVIACYRSRAGRRSKNKRALGLRIDCSGLAPLPVGAMSERTGEERAADPRAISRSPPLFPFTIARCGSINRSRVFFRDPTCPTPAKIGGDTNQYLINGAFRAIGNHEDQQARLRRASCGWAS